MYLQREVRYREQGGGFLLGTRDLIVRRGWYVEPIAIDPTLPKISIG